MKEKKQHAKSYTSFIMYPTLLRIDTKLSMLADKQSFLSFSNTFASLDS